MYIITYIHVYFHTNVHRLIQMYERITVCACVWVYTHTHAHRHTHVHAPVQKHKSIRVNIHSYMHTVRKFAKSSEAATICQAMCEAPRCVYIPLRWPTDRELAHILKHRLLKWSNCFQPLQKFALDYIQPDLQTKTTTRYLKFYKEHVHVYGFTRKCVGKMGVTPIANAHTIPGRKHEPLRHCISVLMSWKEPLSLPSAIERPQRTSLAMILRGCTRLRAANLSQSSCVRHTHTRTNTYIWESNMENNLSLSLSLTHTPTSAHWWGHTLASPISEHIMLDITSSDMTGLMLWRSELLCA